MKQSTQINLIFVVALVILLGTASVAYAGNFYASAGVGRTRGDTTSIYDHNGNSLQDDWIGKLAAGYEHYYLGSNVEMHIGIEHFSSAEREDPGFNWGGVELRVKFW